MEKNEAWSDVGQHFSQLGQTLKTHYQQAGGTEPRPELDEALKGLLDSLGHAFEAFGNAARDPELATASKQTAKSLAQAVTVTFGEVGGQLRERLRPSATPGDGGDTADGAAAEDDSTPS